MKKSGWIVIAAVVALIIVYELVNGLSVGDTESDGSGGDSAPSGDLASQILSAISGFENVGSSHNNPGGLSTAVDGTMVPNTYDSPGEGAAAALGLIAKKLAEFPAITVQQFVNLWQSGKLNPTDPQYADALKNYAQHVADELGLGVNDPISDADSGGDGGAGSFPEDDSTDDDDDE